MADARDCGIIWATIQRAGSGYVGEFSSYIISMEQSDRVLGTDTEIVSIRDRVQSGTSDEGWTIHADGSLQYRGRVVVPQLIDLREEILREFHCSQFTVHLVAQRYTRIFVASTIEAG